MEDSLQVRKRVWLLGAGFSRSLGGPLMFDLLSLTARWQIKAVFGSYLSPKDIDLVFWLFHFGAGFPDGPVDPDHHPRGKRRWRDAEQFLETVDSARSEKWAADLVGAVFLALQNSVPLQSIQMMRDRYPMVFDEALLPFDSLSALVRRTIAASCSTFLEGVTRDTARDKERWRPYQHWLGWLRKDDAILTFNYDRVIELLNPTVRFGVVGSARWAVHVKGVTQSADELDREAFAHAKDLPTLYKLHGSVNWRITANTVEAAGWSPALLGNDSNVAIAVPGDSKMKMTTGVFAALWEDAGRLLREAEEIFIIGFRFPPSDAFPADRLLGALSENRREELKVHLILGPEQNADLRRVLALLHMTGLQKPQPDEIAPTGTGALVPHSMWAEDFLGAWARQEQARHGGDIISTVDE